MRVVLVGTSADRARLRADLDGRLEIVGEFATLAAAAAADVAADIVMSTPRRHAASRRSDDDLDGAVEPLTTREVQVLELLAEGLPNKAIAERLGISDQTVKFHVSAIAGKLGAVNRTDAVRRAVRRGLIAL
jgi:two-component system, NarL family, nitrate/nitrite response regulator NarL